MQSIKYLHTGITILVSISLGCSRGKQTNEAEEISGGQSTSSLCDKDVSTVQCKNALEDFFASKQKYLDGISGGDFGLALKSGAGYRDRKNVYA